MKVMGIYCSEELYKRLKDVAWEQRKSLSALVRELINQSLSNMRQKVNKKTTCTD